nr:MAG TPA: hypothetical protein [Caudoviricetes sp.]
MPEGYNGAYTGQQIDEGIAKANGALPQSGGVMTGPLSLAGDPAGENEATRKAYVDNVTQAVQSNLTAHTGNTNNPHSVTAEQVGARPASWTPSAAEVGAVPTSRTVNGKALSADITLSAADVGAAAASHNQSASTITAGTLGGQIKANASAVSTTATAQVRNIYAGTSDMTAGSSSLTTGDIYFVYE